MKSAKKHCSKKKINKCLRKKRKTKQNNQNVGNYWPQVHKPHRSMKFPSAALASKKGLMHSANNKKRCKQKPL